MMSFKDFLLAQAKFSFVKRKSVFRHINSGVRDMMLEISRGMLCKSNYRFCFGKRRSKGRNREVSTGDSSGITAKF